MCELILNAKTETLRKLILQDSEGLDFLTEFLQAIVELMPPAEIFMMMDSDSE
jgi:hypothetical protein